MTDHVAATPDESAAYVAQLRERGVVRDYHRLMAEHDLPVLQAADALVAAVAGSSRALTPQMKELLWVLSLTVSRAEPFHIEAHMRAALEHGITPQEILEALELAIPQAGILAFQHGFDVWRRVVGAEPRL